MNELEDYDQMRAAAVRVEGELLDTFVQTCQTNPWIKVGGAEFEPEGFCPEHDYPFYLERYDDIEMLKCFFRHGNWGIRTAVQHRDLIFVNQVNAGDEWWTLKILSDQLLLPFESITFQPYIDRGEFEELIDRMVRATPEQCQGLHY